MLVSLVFMLWEVCSNQIRDILFVVMAIIGLIDLQVVFVLVSLWIGGFFEDEERP